MTSNAMLLKWLRSSLGLMLGCLGFVTLLRCEAQNLVPNPGFEEADTCSNMSFGIEGPLHWFSANGSPDHLQSCLPYGAFNGLPLNFVTYQEPYEGASCAGVHTYFHSGLIDHREWMMAPLLEPMVPGETYYCSFRANAAFGGNAQYPNIWLANDKVGMLFTMQARPWSFPDPEPVRPNYSHMMHQEILSDTVGWTLVSGSFVADSAYQYVMIGQFFSNALTDTLQFAPPGDPFYWYPRAYTLVDAVCVSPNPDGCELGLGMEEMGPAGPIVYPNPAKDVLVVGNAAGSEGVVLDMLGRRVWSDRVNHDRFTVDVGSWARGTYVLQVHGGRGVQIMKFVLTE